MSLIGEFWLLAFHDLTFRPCCVLPACFHTCNFHLWSECSRCITSKGAYEFRKCNSSFINSLYWRANCCWFWCRNRFPALVLLDLEWKIMWPMLLEWPSKVYKLWILSFLIMRGTWANSFAIKNMNIGMSLIGEFWLLAFHDLTFRPCCVLPACFHTCNFHLWSECSRCITSKGAYEFRKCNSSFISSLYWRANCWFWSGYLKVSLLVACCCFTRGIETWNTWWTSVLKSIKCLCWRFLTDFIFSGYQYWLYNCA